MQEYFLKISNLVALAEIIKEWGVKGQVKALPLIDSFYSLSTEDIIIATLSSGVSKSIRIKSLKKLSRYALLSFYGIDDIDTALEYRGAILSADKSLLTILQDGEYFYEQLIGLIVCTTDGNIIGRVSDIFATGSNDVYVVKGTDKDYLIPAIHDVVKQIRLDEGKIIIQKLEGLLD